MIGAVQTIPFGERVSDGRIVTAIETPRGEACGCVCPDCGMPLQAHQGEKVSWHFQHKADAVGGCGFGAETGLHKFAKQVIAEKKTIYLPPLKAIAPGRMASAVEPGKWALIRNVRLEQRIAVTANSRSSYIVPDIVAAVGKRVKDTAVWNDVLIEIFVSHKATVDKRYFVQEHKIPAFEIDLSGLRGNPAPELYGCTSDILRDARRYWLWHPQQDAANAALEEQIRQRTLLEIKQREQSERLADRLEEHRRLRAEIKRRKAELSKIAKAWEIRETDEEKIQSIRNERERWLREFDDWITRKANGDQTLAREMVEWNRDWRERIE